ncbi:MAG: 16S rRNA (adenine(1518)-N(6)/adenine(1519)-N(6))-dimethyltransferase RsmA [Bacteroidaceae bacterium]|nr:16S rRNA (adenine(1518)-N(6)/adenine(1519)-N(6))-dimethyltransferase RsmA [Bacteroidaceae bacterium]
MNRVRAKKNLGQHFLTDMTIARRIADTVDACPDLPLLEVGPGMGALTQFLLVKNRLLNVVELDQESIAYLRSAFPPLRGRIIEGDFLKMDLRALHQGRPFVLTGNYPYNISSQIFFKMLDNRDLIPCCTGMIQKEVAERLASGPGNKAYGILSVLLQAWYDVEYLFTVPETVFSPPPKVKSAVIRFTRNQVQDLGCDETLFKRLVKMVFNQRRKMMRSSIRPLLSQLDAERKCQGRDHTPFLQSSVMTCRPEQLSVQDFIQLTLQVSAEYGE